MAHRFVDRGHLDHLRIGNAWYRDAPSADCGRRFYTVGSGAFCIPIGSDQGARLPAIPDRVSPECSPQRLVP